MFCLSKDMGYDVLFPRRSGPRQRVLKRCMADKLEQLKEHDFRWTWLVSESYIFHAPGIMAQSQNPYWLSDSDAALICNNNQMTPSAELLWRMVELYERFWDLEEEKVRTTLVDNSRDRLSVILFTNSRARIGPNS